MPTPKPQVHVGDRGTRYLVKLIDEVGAAVDPTDCTTKQLIFLFANGDEIVKDADVLADGSPATSWMLTYRVTEGDGIGSPAGEFHARNVKFNVQGYVEWADGSRFHTTVHTVADNGMELRVSRNLRPMNDANGFDS